MNASDTTAVNPRHDDPNTASILDQDSPNPPINDPKTVPNVSPGPDTREEPYSPK